MPAEHSLVLHQQGLEQQQALCLLSGIQWLIRITRRGVSALGVGVAASARMKEENWLSVSLVVVNQSLALSTRTNGEPRLRSSDVGEFIFAETTCDCLVQYIQYHDFSLVSDVLDCSIFKKTNKGYF